MTMWHLFSINRQIISCLSCGRRVRTLLSSLLFQYCVDWTLIMFGFSFFEMFSLSFCWIWLMKYFSGVIYNNFAALLFLLPHCHFFLFPFSFFLPLSCFQPVCFFPFALTWCSSGPLLSFPLTSLTVLSFFLHQIFKLSLVCTFLTPMPHYRLMAQTVGLFLPSSLSGLLFWFVNALFVVRCGLLVSFLIMCVLSLLCCCSVL